MHIARNTPNGLLKPEHVLDGGRKRIVLNSYHAKKQWRETSRCDPRGGAPKTGHLTAAVLFDVDGDGDQDLLLGDHLSEYVYVRINNGSAARPRFASRNELLRTRDGKPLTVQGTASSFQICDWNGDQLPDVLVSAFGNSFTLNGEASTGGAVFVLLDTSSEPGLQCDATTALLPPADGRLLVDPARPVHGIYAHAADYDHDGDLDLIVGGNAMWRPIPANTTGKDRYRVAELQSKSRKMSEQQAELAAKDRKKLAGLTEEERTAKLAEIFQAEIFQRMQQGQLAQSLRRDIRDLLPKLEKEFFVWAYTNLEKR
ncbi:MAG: FG-GAP-like repeat-containing protein [Planctomycetota bacterium]